MIHLPINLAMDAFKRRTLRHAIGSLEVLVAFTLLATVLSVSAPLLIRNNRLIASQRDYRLSLDELSNQLDRLTTLSPAELPAAIERLVPSDFVIARLPGAKLSGELQPSDPGTRITLKLSWENLGNRRAPVALTAWVYPKLSTDARQAEGETP